MASSEERVAGIADRQRERHRQPHVGGDVEHRLQHRLVVAGDQVGHELDQAAAGVVDPAGDRLDLVVPGVEARNRLSAFGLVDRQPRRREAQRAGLDRLGRQLAHQGEVLGGGGFAVDAALTHHVHPQRGVRKERRHIDVALARIQGVEELREGLPGPRQAVDHHHAGDVLDAGHHVDEHVVVLGPARREADAAVAHHRGGDAVRRRRRQAFRPDGLAVVMGVQVDEARGDEQAGRVDLAGARCRRRSRPRR